MLLENISNFNNLIDWLPIIAATCLVETYVVFRAMKYPSVGRMMYKWYSDFNLIAVHSDILIVLIGFVIARYVYTYLLYPRYGFNIWLFILTIIVIQIIHDVLYYFIVVQPTKRGSNVLIDFMKDYGKEYKVSAIVGDSLILIATAFIAMYLKGYPLHVSITVLIASIYIIQYSITTRRQ
jgi:divalent metal cation (Fe/Co/Zn/Cd) transporter